MKTQATATHEEHPEAIQALTRTNPDFLTASHIHLTKTKLLITALACFGSALVAHAQQVTGELGSPSATTTIPGKE